ncbi:cytochrome P450 6j1-like [Periplaneta americana]|uniref:cytochrome P450 6j1-like n=1 Tax=Periplaneta americana TaxID=6978 RepID=UPI0037E82B3F
MALLFDSLALDLLTIFTVVLAVLYLYLVRNFDFWKKSGIPFVPPVPLFGCMKEVILQKSNIGHHMKTLYDAHRGLPYVGIFTVDHPALLVRDIALVKRILLQDAHCFLDRIIKVDETLDPLNGKAIFALTGRKWKYVRASLSPAFTPGKMRRMFYLVDECGQELVRYLDVHASDGRPVQVNETMARFTTDVIASCAFGIESNSLKNPDSEFRHFLCRLCKLSVVRAFASLTTYFAPALQSVLRLRIMDDDVLNFFRNTVWSTVEYREKNNVERRDFLDNMMELRKRGKDQETSFSIDGDDFVAQAFAFLLAGFETASTTLSHTLYELALHPEIQSRLRNEISQVMATHKNELTYDVIQDITYLDMVMSETLRKYPVVTSLERKCLNDYNLPCALGKGNVVLRANTDVFIPVYALHHDPEFFPEPEKFDPERFTEGNKRERPTFCYLPFGEGPRNCIGIRFGQLQVKTGLIHILSHYNVEPCTDTPVSLVFDPKVFHLKTVEEIPLAFRRIEQTQ